MKKNVFASVLAIALMGCEDATKMIDQAQEAANKAVDSVQEKVESVDLAGIDLGQFGDAAESAQALTESIDELLNADFGDPLALAQVTDQFANAYQCLIDATTESSAEKIVNKVLESIGNPDAQSLIEKGIEKAQQAQSCVM
ncbi:hypothetical protein [Vibrio sonorensis]|uniref:hypothetical protein n=1 Tax=Vibrio sonorensis TaxID=1004316 RepID=UPI0008DADF83|nr:hypothetical protein [Vibrio sonorensis]